MGSARRTCLVCGGPLAGPRGGGARGVCIQCAATRATPVPAPAAPGEAAGKAVRDRSPAGPPEVHFRVLERVEADHPAPGAEVGGFVLLWRLGEGGMGSVYLARDPNLDREVAVKFLRRDLLGSDRARRLFVREGRALAGIDHPHVVRVHAVADWNGWPYLVMERLEGTTLAHRLAARRPLPVEEALRIARELADALAAVHAKRIAHRDVNPSNVFLRAPDGAACLIDFGLARALDRVSRSTGGVAGTPLYMPPEQISGGPQDLRVDVYAFGVTLFEMLAGAPPHASLEPGAFFRAVLHEDAPPLRTRRADAPRALEVMVARCLARAREFRPVDGAALVEALRAASTPAPAGARGTGTPPAGFPAKPPEDPSESLPLLGRDAAYAAAAGAVGEAAEGRGRVVLVEGAPGSGKSRFLREVERAARAAGMEVLRTAEARASGAAFSVLRAAVLGAGRRPAARLEEVLRRVREASPGNRHFLPVLRWLLAERALGPEAPAPAEVRPAALALFRALVRDRPTLLSVDDAHLVDEGSLDVLLAVAEECASWPLALALAFRPPAALARGAPFTARRARLAGLPHAVPAPMGPLTEDDVAEMTRRLLRIDPLEARRFAPLLQRRSAGSPLYLVECLRLLEQDGIVRDAEGRRRLRRRLTSLTIPPRLLELALRRTAGLPSREREALAVVSVDPAGVPSAVVARCLGIARVRALQVLQRLVEARGLVAEDGERYRIPHAEIREAVYGGTIPELRRAYHETLVRFLQAEGGAGSDPARLGSHLRLAGHPADAVPQLVEAGRRLLARNSPVEALASFEDALACAGEADCPGARMGRGRALEALGDLEAARAALEAEAAEGRPARGEALLELAAFERNRGHNAAASACLDGAAALAAPPGMRLRYLKLRAQVASRLERFEEALEAVGEARALERHSSPESLLTLRMTEGTVRWRRGEFEEAFRIWSETLPLAEECGSQESASVLLLDLSIVCSDLGRADEARTFAETAVERAVLVGSDRTLAFARLQLADLSIRTLRLDEAAAVLDAVEESLDRLGSDQAGYTLAARRGEVALARGLAAEAIRWADRGLALAADRPRHAASLRLLRAEGFLLSGRAGEAVEEARRAREAFETLGAAADAEEALALAARSLREDGRDGPERLALRALRQPGTVRGAAAAALEAATPGEAGRLADLAARLARDPWDRREVRAILDQAGAGNGPRVLPPPSRTV